MLNRISYLLLLISLNSGYFFIRLLTTFHFLLPRSSKKKDVMLFPYGQKGSIGYTLRFEQYFALLQQDNKRYGIANIMSHERYIELHEGKLYQQYYLYHLVLWKRIFQTLEARNYQTAFVQRGLFPGYPDLKEPYLEKLLRKLNDHITFDYWDAVWLNNEEIMDKTVKHCDTISVVNEFIEHHFRQEKAATALFPIGFDLSKYEVKSAYETGKEVRLFYTAQPYNLSMFLKIVEPVLLELKKKYNFKLVVVSRGRINLTGIDIEYHDFDEQSFYNIMNGCDMGLFAIEKNEVSMGKMAMKALDYMAGGLPMVVSPVGLPACAVDEENALFASDEKEWLEKISRLMDDQELRKRLGTAARKAVEKEHDLPNSYRLFKEIVGF